MKYFHECLKVCDKAISLGVDAQIANAYALQMANECQHVKRMGGLSRKQLDKMSNKTLEKCLKTLTNL